jgi:SAM-dependent methyltransferase
MENTPVNEHTKEDHYRGSIAQWYDKLLETEARDIAFYKSVAVDNGGKVLELACGTGRLLVPIRRAGVDIEGLDISADMLSLCRQKLEAENLTATLYEQDMLSFDTGQQYKTIFISGGSFQLIEKISDAMALLKMIHSHLHPKGQLVLDICSPWNLIRLNQDGQWRIRRTAKNEHQEELRCHECLYFDLVEQIQSSKNKYELYRKDRLVDTFCGEMNLRWYGKHEFTLMLKQAGFSKVRTQTATIIEQDGEALVFFARKD